MFKKKLWVPDSAEAGGVGLGAETMDFGICGNGVHWKQLDFGSMLGPNGEIMLEDDTILRILHVHVRAEAITNLSFQSTFSAFHH